MSAQPSSTHLLHFVRSFIDTIIIKNIKYKLRSFGGGSMISHTVGAIPKILGANHWPIFHENCMNTKQIGSSCTWSRQCHIKSLQLSIQGVYFQGSKAVLMLHTTYLWHNYHSRVVFCRVSVISVTTQAVLPQTFFRGKGTTDSHEIKIFV